MKCATALFLVPLTLLAGVPIPLGFWQTGGRILDNLDSYSNFAAVHGLNGGTNWKTPYCAGINKDGIVAGDDLDSYSDGVSVNGLNGGYGFRDPYRDGDSQLSGFYGADNLDSYADGAALNGLNANTPLSNGRIQNWATAFCAN